VIEIKTTASYLSISKKQIMNNIFHVYRDQKSEEDSVSESKAR